MSTATRIIRAPHATARTCIECSMATMVAHVGAMLGAGVTNAFDIPGFEPELISPLFCEGRGPFRGVALSGDPEDIHVNDEAALEMFGNSPTMVPWLELVQERVAFQEPTRETVDRQGLCLPMRGEGLC